ncbi:hypothetical protein [Carnobacterium maltaromaticum]
MFEEINIGSFLAPIILGAVQNKYHDFGFSIAAFGMLAGLI